MAKKRPRRSSSKQIPERPTCNCLLLCDDVTQSARGKHTLHGVIGTIGAATFPTTLGGFVTYVRISNVYGDQLVTLALEGGEGEPPVIEAQVQLNHPDPLGVSTIISVVPPFRVERPGRYHFVAYSKDREILAMSPIEVVKAQVIGRDEE